MKYLKQFFIVLFITMLGELMNYFIPLPVPASFYGIVLMLTALGTGIVKVSDIKETSAFLIAAMSVMFMPANVSLIKIWGDFKQKFWPYVIITVVTTFIIMITAGRVTQFMIRRENSKGGEAK